MCDLLAAAAGQARLFQLSRVPLDQPRAGAGRRASLVLVQLPALAPILSHHIPLEDGDKGFKLMSSYEDGIIKPLITI